MSGLYRWAHPTWIFFHTFAAKVNKQFFEANRDQCLSIIKMTCGCLPCPECTGHATAFMKTVNGNNVKTKEDLINMLFTFHSYIYSTACHRHMHFWLRNQEEKKSETWLGLNQLLT